MKNRATASPTKPPKRIGALSNKGLMARYDALVQRVQDRIEAGPSSAQRLFLLTLITRLNTRGMRELERRQRASEEQLWKESLFRSKPRPGEWP